MGKGRNRQKVYGGETVMKCNCYESTEDCPAENTCCFCCEKVDFCSSRCVEYDEYEFGEDCRFVEVEDE